MQEHLFPHKLRHFYHGWGRRCQEIDLNIHNNRYRNIHENENINPGRKLQFTPRTLKRFDSIAPSKMQFERHLVTEMTQ